MTEKTATSPGRVACLVFAVAVMACGLVWRSGALPLPATVAKYGGSVLWGAMIAFVVGLVLGRRSPNLVAIFAAAVSAAVEASQAVRYAPLDAFRETAAGALLLGRTFSWWDIAAYWAGIALVWSVLSALDRRARRRGFAAAPPPRYPSPR